MNETFNAALFQLLSRIEAGDTPYPLDTVIPTVNGIYERDIAEALSARLIEETEPKTYKLTPKGKTLLDAMRPHAPRS